MRLRFLLLLAILPACAVLHHVQVSDMDQRGGSGGYPIEIKVSQLGINVDQAGDLIASMSRSAKSKENAEKMARYIGMFQQGPSTGNKVFSENYAEDLIVRLHQECPSGRLTGLMSIRESKVYPVISEEIVKITGYCKGKK